MINITDNGTLHVFTVGCELNGDKVIIRTFNAANEVVKVREVDLKDFDPVLDIDYTQDYINK
jgi:hypothetical protein